MKNKEELLNQIQTKVNELFSLMSTYKLNATEDEIDELPLYDTSKGKGIMNILLDLDLVYIEWVDRYDLIHFYDANPKLLDSIVNELNDKMIAFDDENIKTSIRYFIRESEV